MQKKTQKQKLVKTWQNEKKVNKKWKTFKYKQVNKSQKTKQLQKMKNMIKLYR